MPHWPSKTVTSRLIKYIKSIKVAYNPYLTNPKNPRHSRGAKEFFVRLQSNRMQKSNPKLLLDCDVHNRVWEGEGAKIEVAFADDTNMELENFTGQVNEIEEEMYQRAAEIEFAFEEAGKSIE